MTKKRRRTNEFSVLLEISDDHFVCPPREAQRNVLLNNAIDEFCDDLYRIDELSRNFVAGDTVISIEDRTQKELSDEQIMEDWQIPVMHAMAKLVTAKHGDVLEVGFGRGVASDLIQEHGVRSHTIIECNDSVVERYRIWKDSFEDRKIDLIHGLWQDTINELGEFDGIFFHTYPLNQEEYMKFVVPGSTFAEHFFDSAADHLSENGVFTYLTNEIDSLSRAHQRALFRRFSSIRESVVELEVPNDVKDTWWANSMVVVEAVK